MLRARLLRLTAEEHALLLSLHHVATDGWSTGVLVRELAALYRRFAGDVAAARPAAPVRRLRGLAAAVAGRGRAWPPSSRPGAGGWQALPAVLELPADRPRPAVQSFRGALEPAELPPALVADLRGPRPAPRGHPVHDPARRLPGAAPPHHGQRRPRSWARPSPNRNRPELEGLIGFFVNTLVLRADLAGDPAFRELSPGCARRLLAPTPTRTSPSSAWWRSCAPERGLAHAPLFQVMFALVEAPPPAGPRAGPPARPRGDPRRHRQVRPLPGGEPPRRRDDGGRWSTRRDLFDRATAARLLACLRELLAGVAAAPGARLSELPLLDARQRKQVLRGVERHGRARSRTSRSTSTAVAARPAWRRRPWPWSWDGGAAHLRRAEPAGEPPGPPPAAGWEWARRSSVGLRLERSPELVVAALAVLKAGGAYVPLDPAIPRRAAGLRAGRRRGPAAADRRAAGSPGASRPRPWRSTAWSLAASARTTRGPPWLRRTSWPT